MKNKMIEISDSPLKRTCDLVIEHIEELTPIVSGEFANGAYDVHMKSGKCFKVWPSDYKKIKTHFDII